MLSSSSVSGLLALSARLKHWVLYRFGDTQVNQRFHILELNILISLTNKSPVQYKTELGFQRKWIDYSFIEESNIGSSLI